MSHKPNHIPLLHTGPADELVVRVYWQESSEGDWAETTLTKDDVRDAQYLGVIEIEDARHSVFRLADGRTVAQVTNMKRNARGGACKQIVIAWVDEDQELVDRGAPDIGVSAKFRSVLVPRAVMWLRSGTESDVSKAQAHAATLDYPHPAIVAVFPKSEREPLEKARELVMKKYNRNSSPPPPPRRRRRTTDTSLRRVRDIVQHEERPFDPERRYPRETKPHHFSINAGPGMGVPAEDELLNEFRDLNEEGAAVIVRLATIVDQPEELETEIETNHPETERYVRSMYRSPYNSAMWRRTVALHAMDKILGTYGVEALPGADYEYLNAGDTYATTLIFDRDADRLFIGSMGDVVEEREPQKIDDAWDSWARGEFESEFVKQFNAESPDGFEIDDWPEDIDPLPIFRIGAEISNEYWHEESDGNMFIQMRPIVEAVIELITGKEERTLNQAEVLQIQELETTIFGED